MPIALQGSLLDSIDEVGLRALGPAIRRTVLARGAWIDVRPGWLTGADELFTRLARDIPWQREHRAMYEREVEVPRLLSYYGEDEHLPEPVLEQARSALSSYYWPELGEPLCTAGLCFYRNGRDSVAWHGDTIGRGAWQDTVVAIISVGAPRALLLRPRGGPGPTTRHVLGHGDLLVMGGACQMRWEHAVPKRKYSGPRVSCSWRWSARVSQPGSPS